MNQIVSHGDFLKTYKLRNEKALQKYKHYLPLYPSPTLAMIVGSLITDGFVDVRDYYRSRKYGYVGFFSKYQEELESFGEAIFSIFGVKGKIRPWGVRRTGESYGYILTNSFVTRTLTLAGVPYGNKTRKKYEVPTWILQGDKEIKRSFLRASFDCEGSVFFCTSKKSWEIKYNMYKSEEYRDDCKKYLSQLQDMLADFGIKTTNIFKGGNHIRKDQTKAEGFEIRIRTPESLKTYKEMIGFGSPRKAKRLEMAVINGPGEI